MRLLWALLACCGNGVITGNIHSKEPVAITVLQGSHEIARGVTDSQGNFSFTLPAGDYSIRTSSTIQSVSVVSDKTSTVDLEEIKFFDEPQFTVAGVTDNTYRGGHGSDNVLRSSESLTKATASLGDPNKASSNPLEAVQTLQKAAEINPSEPNLFNWGTELLTHKASEAAAEVFTKGTHLYPHSERMLIGLATSRYAAGSYQKAAQCFFAAIDVNPDNPVPYAFLIKTQSNEISQSAGYRERFARFAKTHPDNGLAQYYYAMSRSDPEETLSSLNKAIRLDPHIANAFLELGALYTAREQYPQAITALEKALTEDPNLEEAHYRLSEAYRLTGNRTKAQQELETFQKLSKQSTAAREQERREIQRFVIALKEKK